MSAQTTRPTNAVQLYAFGEPDGSTVKLGLSRNTRTRKAQHERRGPVTTTMRELAIWWGMQADEAYLKEHFRRLALPSTTEWFRADPAMRAWLIEMRKQHFVAHASDEIDEMPFVDSAVWLPGMNNHVSVSAAGQLALDLTTPADDPWADVTVVRDKVGEGDFYSPPALLEAARTALGAIDLDPASCRNANREVKARRYYSWHEDGLTQPWSGRLWINPPFPWEPWTTKFCHEWDAGNIAAAIILCETRVTTARYFHKMVERSAAVLKMNGRLHFWGPKAGSPDERHELYFYGSNVAAFADAFAPFGKVFVPHYDGHADALGSYDDAVRAIGADVKAGRRELPEFFLPQREGER